ncbi:hypothetical protein [Clostridium thermarum]|uniref:hypothetical protein n=1 Tax=Clostridium thermarum TaxID=1716543 RepID=UPI00111CE762|nr:hypothetical protein [Clostridium thermarum]
MTRRYYIIFLVISLIITIATASIKLSQNRVMAISGKAYNAENIDQLIEESPMIIVGEVIGKKDSVKEKRINYKVSEVKVLEILKGNILLDSESVNVIQMDIAQDPAVKEGEKVLLFLETYKGQGYKDGYVCVGLSQGYYRIKNDKLEPSGTLSYSFKKSIEDKQNIVEYIRLQAAVALE